MIVVIVVVALGCHCHKSMAFVVSAARQHMRQPNAGLETVLTWMSLRFVAFDMCAVLLQALNSLKVFGIRLDTSP